jgi:hypothetical protein
LSGNLLLVESAPDKQTAVAIGRGRARLTFKWLLASGLFAERFVGGCLRRGAWKGNITGRGSFFLQKEKREKRAVFERGNNVKA